MSGLFDRLAPLRTSAEMAAHINGILRNFHDPEERAETVEELIDRAMRRGAINSEIALTLRQTFSEILSPSSGA